MKRILFSLIATLFAFSYVMAQDVIVKKDGTILNVYNLEEGPTSYFYTLEPSADAATQKISKSDVFSIKKNGETSTRKIGTGAQTEVKAATENPEPKKAPEFKAVTATISSKYISKNDSGDLTFKARTPDGKELKYKILSKENLTLAVIEDGYDEKRYIIPEYVLLNNQTYTVVEIDEEAFEGEDDVEEVQFPATLKKIGESAFKGTNLAQIILPDGLEIIEEEAFANISDHVSTIYIPSTVRKIGDNCFRNCGSAKSYRGYCQAYFSKMPDFVTERNCLDFGIDEEAVRAFIYRRR